MLSPYWSQSLVHAQYSPSIQMRRACGDFSRGHSHTSSKSTPLLGAQPPFVTLGALHDAGTLGE